MSECWTPSAMKHLIGNVLLSKFQEILEEDLTEAQWSDIESDDMFQEHPYIGGYDADERAFCFSLYSGQEEYWFQVTLAEVRLAVAGQLTGVQLRKAEK